MATPTTTFAFSRLPRSLNERELEGKINLKDLLPHELEDWLEERGEPRYRAKQILKWIYAYGLTDFSLMTDLSKSLRQTLQSQATIPSLKPRRTSQSDSQEAQKFLFELPKGGEVESVQMRYQGDKGKDRVAVCISSQVGCAMGCSFCASGALGLKRHLSTWEIVDQVLQIQNSLRPLSKRVANVVFMGMGEPLHNYSEVMRSVTLLTLPYGLGIGVKHLTISTSGLVPQIEKLASCDLPVRLAISLHAVRDDLRSQIMPINNRFNLESLLTACSSYYHKTKHRVTFEYIMLDGLNDNPSEAKELVRLLKHHDIGALINLIPWNPVEGVAFKRSQPRAIRRFQAIIESSGFRCTVRREKGADIDAACGQLRLRDIKEREKKLDKTD